MNSHPYEGVIQQFRSAQTSIMDSLKELNDLNQAYITKQEKQFMSTFLYVMDQMSTELRIAQQKYQNIDKEIESDYRCIALKKQLEFLQGESFCLQQQLVKAQHQLNEAKNKRKILKEMKNRLDQAFVSKYKKLEKYRCLSRTRQMSIDSNKKMHVPYSKSVDLRDRKQEAMPQNAYYTQHSILKTPEKAKTNYGQQTIQKKQPIIKYGGRLKKEKEAITRTSLRTTQKQSNTIKFLRNSDFQFKLSDLLE